MRLYGPQPTPEYLITDAGLTPTLLAKEQIRTAQINDESRSFRERFGISHIIELLMSDYKSSLVYSTAERIAIAYPDPELFSPIDNPDYSAIMAEFEAWVGYREFDKVPSLIAIAAIAESHKCYESYPTRYKKFHDLIKEDIQECKRINMLIRFLLANIDSTTDIN